MRQQVAVALSMGSFLLLLLSGQARAQEPGQSCPPSPVDSVGWHRVVARIAPVSFQLPAKVPEYNYRHAVSFATPGTPKPLILPRQFFFSPEDRLRGGLSVTISAIPRPAPDTRLSVGAADSTVCGETIGGHLSRIIVYRSVPSGRGPDGQPFVHYNVFAWIDLSPDSVLEFEGGGTIPLRQTEALAVLRTLRFGPPAP